MILYRSALCALVLFVVTPMAGVGAAQASWPKGMIGSSKNATLPTTSPRRLTVIDDGTASSIRAEIESDAGDEEVTLVESDAWLHGAATIEALPTTEATLTLTLYDTASAALMSFSGTLGADGALELAADTTKGTSADCASRTGCTSDTTSTTVDVELLAAVVFKNDPTYYVSHAADHGARVMTFDLAGADTYEVAYATVKWTVPCDITAETGICLKEGSTSTSAEVGWDAVGAIWEGELSLDHEGVVETKVKTYSSAGKKLVSSKVQLGAPWLDGGEGVNVLATDEDPLTTVGLVRLINHDDFEVGAEGWSDARLVVNSEGWTTTTVPVSAKVELTNGDTITIPVNSYQRKGRGPIQLTGRSNYAAAGRVLVTSGGSTVFDSSEFEVGEPSCSGGTCVSLLETEAGDYELAVSEYGLDAAKLADKLALTVVIYDESGVKESSESASVELDDDVTAVFANELSFSEDPIGLDLSGKVSLLDAPNKKGKQSTLAKGKFYSSFSRDGDGELNLAGADKDAVSSSGHIVVAGGAVAIELTTDTDKDGELNAPPVSPLYGTEGARVVRVRSSREREARQQK